MEAEAIKERLARDPAFKLFALDPTKTGQDYANLRLYLEKGETYMNKQAWEAFIDHVPTEEEQADAWKSMKALSGEPEQ